MDAQQFISEFLNSEHGAQAVQALGAQGVSEADAQQLLTHAAGASYAQVEEQHSGVMGEHAGKSFFSAFASEAESFSLADSVIRLTGGHGDAVSA